MNINFLSPKEKKKLFEEIENRFGITKEKLKFLFFETGKEKIRAFSGTMTREEVYELGKIANVELIGLYFAKKEGRLRLSFDAATLLRKEELKSIVEINEDSRNLWMRGENLDIAVENGVYLIKNKDDVLGCGISDGKKIINCVPKERRIRKKQY